jgi:glycosyltransferase involved in cell wall biosynthesis
MAWTVKRAAAIITVSEHSKRDILRAFGVPEERVFVTYEATDERFHPLDEDGQAAAVNAKYGLPERFVLYVGSAERRKNLEILVRAWARVAARMREREIRLVIVARFPPPDPLYPDVPALARELGLGRDVLFVPQIREEDKPDLYRASLVFCFPSTYEGFGFPALEAMACGIPVIASNATSIPEVVGDSACLLEPYDTAAWADALLTLADSPSQRESMRQRGLERAARFSWRCTAEQTVEVYREVLGR